MHQIKHSLQYDNLKYVQENKLLLTEIDFLKQNEALLHQRLFENNSNLLIKNNKNHIDSDEILLLKQKIHEFSLNKYISNSEIQYLNMSIDSLINQLSLFRTLIKELESSICDRDKLIIIKQNELDLLLKLNRNESDYIRNESEIKLHEYDLILSKKDNNINYLNNSISDLRNSLISIEKEYLKVKENINNSENNSNSLSDRIGELTEENNQLKIQLDERIKQTNEKINILNNFQDVTTNVIDLNLQINREKESKLKIENKLKVMFDESISLKERIEELIRENERLTYNLKELNYKNNEDKRTYLNFLNIVNINENSSIVDTLNRQLTKLHYDLQSKIDIEIELNKLKEEMRKANEENECLKDSNSKLSMGKDFIIKELVNKNQMDFNLLYKIDLEKYNNSEKLLIEKDKIISEIKEENKNLKEKLNCLINKNTENSKLLGELNDEITELSKKNIQLQRDLSSKETILDNFKDSLVINKKEIKDKMTIINTFCPIISEISTIMDLISNKGIIKEIVNEDLTKFSSFKQKLEEFKAYSNNNNEPKLKVLENQNITIESVNKRENEEITKLQLIIENLKSENINIKKTNSELYKQNSNLEEEIKEILKINNYSLPLNESNIEENDTIKENRLLLKIALKDKNINNEIKDYLLANNLLLQDKNEEIVSLRENNKKLNLKINFINNGFNELRNLVFDYENRLFKLQCKEENFKISIELLKQRFNEELNKRLNLLNIMNTKYSFHINKEIDLNLESTIKVIKKPVEEVITLDKNDISNITTEEYLVNIHKSQEIIDKMFKEINLKDENISNLNNIIKEKTDASNDIKKSYILMLITVRKSISIIEYLQGLINKAQ